MYTARASTQFVAVRFFFNTLPTENFHTQKYVCFLRASPVANGNLWFTADLFPFVLNGRRWALNSILKAGRKSERENASEDFPWRRSLSPAGLPAFVKHCVGNCALEKCAAFVTPVVRVCMQHALSQSQMGQKRQE